MELLTVRLSSSLCKFNGGKTQVLVPLCNLGSLPAKISEQCPPLKPFLVTAQGKVSDYINIYVNGQDWRLLKKDSSIQASDRIEIVTSLVGG